MSQNLSLRHSARVLGILAVVASLALGIVACGGSADRAHRIAPASLQRESSSPTGTDRPTPSRAVLRPATVGPKDANDGDMDASTDDDLNVIDFGHAASPQDRRTITTLIRRYLKAAAAEDGVAACALQYVLFAEALVEQAGQAVYPATLSRDCAADTTRLFQLHHRELTAQDATLEIVGARVRGGRGVALLRFAAGAELHQIAVHREGSAWKIAELIDRGMP